VVVVLDEGVRTVVVPQRRQGGHVDVRGPGYHDEDVDDGLGRQTGTLVEPMCSTLTALGRAPVNRRRSTANRCDHRESYATTSTTGMPSSY
jgi:hypothetical protein